MLLHYYPPNPINNPILLAFCFLALNDEEEDDEGLVGRVLGMVRQNV